VYYSLGGPKLQVARTGENQLSKNGQRVSCGPRLSAHVLFTKGQKCSEYDFMRVAWATDKRSMWSSGQALVQ
jgi:hypothetical protein